MGINGCGVSERMVWSITNGDHVGRWVAERINGAFHSGSTAIGLERNGNIVAGVLYEHWNGRSVVAHMAASGRLTPAYVAAIFDYAFNVCGCHKVILPVASTNAKSGKFVRKLGFTQESHIRDASPDGDIVFYTLTKQDCRFLGSTYHRKIRTVAPSRS